MMIVTILLSITLCLILKFILLNKRVVTDIDKIPGPKPWPIIGNVLEFGSNTSEQLENQLRLVKEYGPMVKVWMGSALTIILTDIDKVEYILSSNIHNNKSRNYKHFENLLGGGLILSSGELWRKHRKLITPSFHFKLIEGFSEYITSNGQILLQKLNSKLHEKCINIAPLINLFTLDVISESAMKVKINAQENSDTDYIYSIKTFMNVHILRFFSFFEQFDFIFKMTSNFKRQQKSIKILRDFTKDVIRTRKEQRVVDSSAKEDEYGIKRKKVFLDHLLDLQQNEDLLTDAEIGNEVQTFMFAGHDTVKSAISFALYELAKYPEIQEKLVQESNEKVGCDKEIELNFKDINELKYLDMVFKECIRINPPVPFIERELQTDVIFDEINIPKGTTIQILIYAIHNNKDIFPNPEKFDPERFSSENTKNRHPFAYIPFSAGARNCIGFRYAQLLTKTTILYILRNFKVFPVPGKKPILCNNAILESVNGLHVRLEAR